VSMLVPSSTTNCRKLAGEGHRYAWHVVTFFLKINKSVNPMKKRTRISVCSFWCVAMMVMAVRHRHRLMALIVNKLLVENKMENEKRDIPGDSRRACLDPDVIFLLCRSCCSFLRSSFVRWSSGFLRKKIWFETSPAPVRRPGVGK
jgi:hypothetical protein